jgi:hypothetical protein|tara:strand:+ start:308 stop:616 length:309 start_codon:yes stop_codon:yes gene_type:complete
MQIQPIIYNFEYQRKGNTRKSIKGRFEHAEKTKKFWSSWDTAVNTMERQLNPNSSIYRHRNSLVDKISLSDKQAQDYKMKVFDCDRATKKAYEDYYKEHKYT